MFDLDRDFDECDWDELIDLEGQAARYELESAEESEEFWRNADDDELRPAISQRACRELEHRQAQEST